MYLHKDTNNGKLGSKNKKLNLFFFIEQLLDLCNLCKHSVCPHLNSFSLSSKSMQYSFKPS